MDAWKTKPWIIWEGPKIAPDTEPWLKFKKKLGNLPPTFEDWKVVRNWIFVHICSSGGGY